MAPGQSPHQRAVHQVFRLHARRDFQVDGYGYAVCVEDRQAWPCATVQAIESTLDERPEPEQEPF